LESYPFIAWTTKGEVIRIIEDPIFNVIKKVDGGKIDANKIDKVLVCKNNTIEKIDINQFREYSYNKMNDVRNANHERLVDLMKKILS
jgi:hypothetical protein